VDINENLNKTLKALFSPVQDQHKQNFCISDFRAATCFDPIPGPSVCTFYSFLSYKDNDDLCIEVKYLIA
jgi:hypothetical protein